MLPTILDQLETHAVQMPEDIAYRFLHDHGDVSAITYRQLEKRVYTLAALFKNTTAFGDRALLLYPQGLEFIAAFLGCLSAGLIAVPAYPPRRNRKTERLASIVADCSPTLVLTTAAERSKMAEWLAQEGIESWRIIATDECETSNDTLCNSARPCADDTAFIQYTSGSTSRPKGVVITHDNISFNERQIEESFGHYHRNHCPESPTTMISWLPLFHDMGLIGGALQPLYVGFPAVLLSPAAFMQEPVRWLKAVTDYHGTTTGAPNFAFDYCARSITDDEKRDLDLSTLKVLYNGAEPVRAETLDRFLSAFSGCGLAPDAFFPCYGLAEATLFVSGGPVAMKPPRLEVQIAELESGRVTSAAPGSLSLRTLVSSGVVANGANVAVVDPQTHARLGLNAIGEVWINSPSVGLGYWGDVAASEETFRNHLDDGTGPYLRTGDLGFMQDADLYITGRLKDVLIIKGRNIYPHDIEMAISAAIPTIPATGCAAFAVEVNGEEQVGLVIESDRALARRARNAGRAEPCPLLQAIEPLLSAIRLAIVREFDVSVSVVAFVMPGGFLRTSSGKTQRRATREAWINNSLDLLFSWQSQQHGAQSIVVSETRNSP